MNFSRCKALILLIRNYTEYNSKISLKLFCTKCAVSLNTNEENIIKDDSNTKDQVTGTNNLIILPKNYKTSFQKLEFEDKKVSSETPNISINLECQKNIDKKSINSDLKSDNNTSIETQDDSVLTIGANNDNYILTNETEEINNKPIKYNLQDEELDSNTFLDYYNKVVTKPLDECTENLSDFGKSLGPTFNIAAYADKSTLIQTFVKLGVKLYKLEKNKKYVQALLTVNEKEELPIYLRFLHDCGVPAESLGDVITMNPMILKEDLDDMKTRIRYMRAHDFTPSNIARIITKNPTWLTWSTKDVDRRLGYFQSEFKLSVSELKYLSTKQPKLITYSFLNIKETTFALSEEMGFDKFQMKHIVLVQPRLLMNNRHKILSTFNYLHNSMNLTHEEIIANCGVLTCRLNRLKTRHEFLLELHKLQLDPTKAGYIAPLAVVTGSDIEFCKNVAKTSVDTYNLFLKTR